ncbi:MAG: hypothetical protein NTNFB02_29880 [Nitrospira sp.]
MNICDDEGFLPVRQSRTIEGTTPLTDVLSKISGETSGFILTESGKAQGYISANQIITNLVETGSWKGLEQQAVIDLIRNPSVDLSMIPVAKQVVAAGEHSDNLQAYRHLIVQVVEGGRLAGFVLPKELISEIHTPPHVYYCTNPDGSHPNNEPRTYCRVCPYPVPE